VGPVDHLGHPLGGFRAGDPEGPGEKVVLEQAQFLAEGVGLLELVVLLAEMQQREFLFQLSPLEASRKVYGPNPFPEAIPVASYIRAHSQKSARIAIWGSEPEIYFYAGRHSATSYIYMYGLMESQPYALTMQQDMIREVTSAAPEFVVEVAGNMSWLRDEKSPTRIFEWWSAYRQQHYRRVGVADTISKDRTEYRWDADAESYHPRSDYHLVVYRREGALTPNSQATK